MNQVLTMELEICHNRASPKFHCTTQLSQEEPAIAVCQSTIPNQYNKKLVIYFLSWSKLVRFLPSHCVKAGEDLILLRSLQPEP